MWVAPKGVHLPQNRFVYITLNQLMTILLTQGVYMVSSIAGHPLA